MESTDKLRVLADECYTFNDCSDKLMAITDEIEREIAERFMELPVDADDVPIRAGDLIEFGRKGERLEVTHIGWTKHGDPTIAYRRPNGTLDSSCIGSECRHVKPRTIEDMLYECFHDCMYKYPNGIESVIAKYADELRSMGVGE